MVFQCINIRQVPWKVLKTAAFGLGFQPLPRNLENVNEWKTMFDLYINNVLTVINVESTLFQRCMPAGTTCRRTAIITEPKCQETYLQTCKPIEDSNEHVHPRSLISLSYPHEETLRPLLSKMCPVKILIRLRECAGWSKSSLGAHVRRYVFWRCSFFVLHNI